MSGDYSSALEAAGAVVHAFEHFGSYQGDWWAKVTYKGETGYVHGYYGSCSVCDAFEAEFGWNEESCETHAYDPQRECPACDAAKAAHAEKLRAFGAEYLDVVLSKEAAVAEASKNLDWDSDAQEMVNWLSNTPDEETAR
jgi:hypothetical protein